MNWHFGKKVNFSIGLGGHAGYLLSSNEQEYQSMFGDSFYFSTTDFGAVGTIVFSYPLTNMLRIGIEYDRQQGFSDLYHGKAGNSPIH